MRVDLSSALTHADTLAAIVIGALVATASGVLANQVETYFRRRERERSAALLFGEVFSTLKVILEGAEAARRRAPPYGPVTRRMLHAARREIDIYDRNREALMDLRDGRLRADMHSVAVRLAMPLDGVLDSLLSPDSQDDPTRDQAMDFIQETLERIPALTARLGRIAGHRFDHYDGMPRPGSASQPETGAG
jgi:hypothetical protein